MRGEISNLSDLVIPLSSVFGTPLVIYLKLVYFRNNFFLRRSMTLPSPLIIPFLHFLLLLPFQNPLKSVSHCPIRVCRLILRGTLLADIVQNLLVSKASHLLSREY